MTFFVKYTNPFKLNPMNSKGVFSMLVVCILLLSCGATMYVPTEKDTIKYNTSLNSLNQGRDLYLNTCGRCHLLHKPSAYTTVKWTIVLNKMQKRSKINDAQKELIFHYLETNAKQ